MVELKQIPVEALVPTRDNPRKVRTDTAEFRELVESVKSVGVLQPLIARPITNGEALRHEHSKKAAQPWPLYDLRAGHRRLEAAKRAGLTSVPVMVHAELDDRTAMEITVTENLQRENLAPLEEARGVKGLLDVGWEVAAIASRLGKSAQWVSRRAKLIDLSPRWVKHVDQGGLCSVWPANLLQIVARLPQHVQNAALEDLECDRSWDDICRDGLPTERELERWIAREYLKTLAAAPFALDNAALLPAAGACTACPKRSGVQASLFDAAEFEEDGPKKKSKKAAPAAAADHCLDQDCYAEKCLAYARSELAAVAKAHGGTALPVLNTRHGGVGYQAAQEFKRCFSKGVLVGNWNSDFEIAPGATPPKGALPGVVCGGPDVGKRVWLVKAKRPSYGGSSGNGAGTHKPAKPAAEVRATRRRAFVLREIYEQLSAPKGELVAAARKRNTALTLVATFGTGINPNNGGGPWAALETKKIGWQAALKAAAAQAEKAAERVVVAALEEAARLAAAHTPDQVREKWPNAQPLCELTGIDFAGLERAALEKFPEPQAAAAGAKAKPATKKSGKTAGKKAVAGGR